MNTKKLNTEYGPIQELRFAGVMRGPVQRLEFAAEATPANASQVLDVAIRLVMTESSASYVDAFKIVQKEYPGLLENWQATIYRR
jgi:hypothetical protein